MAMGLPGILMPFLIKMGVLYNHNNDIVDLCRTCRHRVNPSAFTEWLWG
jgi:hypothetical protein